MFEENDSKVKATPAIRRIAKQYGIDINEVQGTGEGGRVEIENLEEYLFSKKHMSFSEMGQDEPKQEKKPAKEEQGLLHSLNYDNEDYGVLDDDAEIVVEMHPQPKEVIKELTDEEPEEKSLPVNDEDYQKAVESVVGVDNFSDIVSLAYRDAFENATEDKASDSAHSIFNRFEADTDESNEKDEAAGDDIDLTELIGDGEKSEEAKPDIEIEISEEDDDDDDDYGYDEDDDEDEDDDDDECGCGHDHSQSEEQCQPIRIAFSVPRKNMDALLEKSGKDHSELLMDAVVKALALAIYDEDQEFDGRINVVSIMRDEMQVKTAMNALSEKVGYIEYGDPCENDDVFVNVWDLTPFGFNSFARPDAGMVNVFVSESPKKIIIDSISDEYTVCIDTCVFMFKALKENLNDPEAMNERSVSAIVAEPEE